jgi:hypothetical protein
MAWCLVKHRDNLTVILNLGNERRLCGQLQVPAAFPPISVGRSMNGSELGGEEKVPAPIGERTPVLQLVLIVVSI